MQRFLMVALSMLTLLAVSPTLSARQENEAATEGASGAQGQTRREESRQLNREQREARRQEIQGRLEGLSKEEREAFREERRSRQQATERRGRQHRPIRGSIVRPPHATCVERAPAPSRDLDLPPSHPCRR